MSTTRGAEKVWGRLLVGVLLAVAVLMVGAAPSGGQAPIADEVTVDDSFGFGSLISRDCNGVDQTFPGFVEVELSRTGAGVEAGIDPTVSVTYSGSEVSNLLAPPSAVTFLPGLDFAFLNLELVEPGTGSLTISFQPGPGYVLTEPSSVTLDLSEPELVNDCTAPITDGGEEKQTIDVGARPEGFFPLVTDTSIVGDGTCVEFEFADGSGGAGYCVSGDGADLFGGWLATPVVGALPPGLTYADDTWAGAATTPGVYAFKVRLCEDLDDGGDLVYPDEDSAPERAAGGALRDRIARRSLTRAATRTGEDDLFCVGTLDAEVTVVAVTTPPAVPVPAPARFTG